MFLIATLYSTIDKNTKEDGMIFSHMTQVQKKEYVQNYIKNTYGLSSEISADIKKREINAFSSEDHYYAIAKLEDNRRLYCWISNAGKISDSYFVLNMQNNIEKTFEDIINDTILNFKIRCVTTLNSPTDKSYDSDSVFAMLNTESVTTSVRIFLDISNKTVVEKMISNQFDGKLNFTNGCIYIYFVDDLISFDINDTDLTKFDMSFNFKKG